MSHKRIFMLLFILSILLLSITGCTYLQEYGIIPPQTEKPTEQPEAQPQPESPPEKPPAATAPSKSEPTIKTPEADKYTPPRPPSPRPPTEAKLVLSHAPIVGETAELTFTFYSYRSSDAVPTKARVEFERYDPALYYPLGRSREKEDKLRTLAENFDPEDPYHIYLMKAAEEQPVTSVPQEEVLVSGELNWEGVLPLEDSKIRLTAEIRFPEEGEWLAKGWLGTDDGKGRIYDELYLAINKGSGAFGWPEDYSKGVIWTPPNQENPMSITIKPSRAPLLGEPFQITMRIQSIEDLAQAEGTLGFFQMKGTEREIVPLEDILIDGNLTWQGSLKKDTLIELSGTVMFSEEGDWGILEWSRPRPESISMNRNGIFIHIGKEESRFGWTESHEQRLGEGDIKPTPAPTPGKES